jgi:integrase
MKSNKVIIQKEALLKPSFGSVYRTKGSQYLYISFYYFKERLRFPTDRIDTPTNYTELVDFMNDVGTKVRQGTLQFAKVFYWLDEATKRHFSELEGADFKPLPEHVLFGEFAEKWELEKLAAFPSLTKRRDYEDALKSRVLPYFKEMTFSGITEAAVNDFIDSLKRADRTKGILRRRTQKDKKPLVVKRIKHIIAPLKAIWEAACCDNNWNIKNPFTGLKIKYQELNEKAAQERERQAFLRNGDDEEASTRDVLLLKEWQQLKDAVDPHYHVVLELLLLGMIGSEMEALQKRHIRDGFLQVRCAVMKVRVLGKKGEKGRVERHLKFKPKNWYRKRDILLTEKMKGLLGEAAKSVSAELITFDNNISIPANEFILTMKDGSPFNYTSFRKTIWDKAVKSAGIDMRVPYAARHTLVQWALLLGMTKTRLVDLMGHCDKTMIDRVYGQYRKGLVEEKELILNYLGEDFLALEELKVSFPERYRAAMARTVPVDDTKKAPDVAGAFSQSFGQSQGLYADNYLM